MLRYGFCKVTANELLYVFGFATHIIQFKTTQLIGKTDIYNVLAVAFLLIDN